MRKRGGYRGVRGKELHAANVPARHASMGSDVVVMMSATIWLVKNSKTPSDAMTMN